MTDLPIYEPRKHETECPRGDDVLVGKFIKRPFKKHVWARVGDRWVHYSEFGGSGSYCLFNGSCGPCDYGLICIRCGEGVESCWADRPSPSAVFRGPVKPMEALKQGTQILYRDEGTIFGYIREGDTTVFGEDGPRVIAVVMKGVQLSKVPDDATVRGWFDQPELARAYAVKKAKNPTKAFFRLVLDKASTPEANVPLVFNPPVKDAEPFFDTRWTTVGNGRREAIRRSLKVPK